MPLTLGEEQADTLVGDDTLGHAETLLVVATSDAENITGPLGTEGVTLDLSGHALVQERAPDVDESSGREGGKRVRWLMRTEQFDQTTNTVWPTTE